MTDYFWADQHVNHVKNLEYSRRPFPNVQQMHETMITNAWAVVEPADTLWFLGDYGLGDLEDSLAMLSRFPGIKRLVLGNHDRPLNEKTAPRRASAHQRYTDAGFLIEDGTVIEYEIGGHQVLLSHFPYTGDSHGPDRYTEHRAIDRGLPIIHGHVHGEWAERGAQYNVGVDVRGFAPVSEYTIRDWLETL